VPVAADSRPDAGAVEAVCSVVERPPHRRVVDTAAVDVAAAAALVVGLVERAPAEMTSSLRQRQ